MKSRQNFIDTGTLYFFKDSMFYDEEHIEVNGTQREILSVIRYDDCAEIAWLGGNEFYVMVDRSDMIGSLEECEEVLYNYYVKENTLVSEKEINGHTPNKVQQEYLSDLLKEYNRKLKSSKISTTFNKSDLDLADKINVRKWLYSKIVIPAINEALINNKLKNW